MSFEAYQSTLASPPHPRLRVPFPILVRVLHVVFDGHLCRIPSMLETAALANPRVPVWELEVLSNDFFPFCHRVQAMARMHGGWRRAGVRTTASAFSPLELLGLRKWTS
ncbi:hypothetical protein MPTK1_3g23750 [Marchantia polymorpha subsp. ruderalis]|uniref:Uncharacterized protein n=2 Tax=Marchantia polymorpha TaxID=3197 RepID=A0AAF6B431_MARPO|nr:hypothetical protein MARPO_0121s0047 [Marchantia polymorpha]BBN06765.1 hypothetical protein Mp_3g23750 [Marchantia polymorpha subsp. ruderalis]|eukprot:PTQ30710.1 hypothetical protein MARPO_0121s0047 [Marchantia polymorpha]